MTAGFLPSPQELPGKILEHLLEASVGLFEHALNIGSCCSRRERSTSTIRTIATTSAIATALTAAPTAIHVVVVEIQSHPGRHPVS